MVIIEKQHIYVEIIFYKIIVVREYILRSILLDPLYFLVLENKLFLPCLSFFRVYKKDVLLSSFYSLYLKYEHGLL